MADFDPISGSSTPNKRRKLENGKAWDSQDDSGEEFVAEDFNTVATVPMSGTEQHQLQYTREQFHSDLRTNQESTNAPRSDTRTYITQPTQTMRISSPVHTSDVLVDRSSPVTSPPPKAPPQPIRRALSKPTILASAMAPPGTSFRAPLGIQRSKPAPVQIDSDSEDDPPVHHSSDEGETQGLRSNLKPTNFLKGGRGLDSTPNRNVVRESPRPPATLDTFKNLMSEFGHNSPSTSKVRPPDDMISAYGSSARRPKPLQTAKAPPKHNAVPYHTIDEIQNYALQKKVIEIQRVFTQESVQRCVDALSQSNANVEDAMAWLTADEERDAPGEDDDDGEIAASSTIMKRGVAVKSQSSQPVRSATRQEMLAPKPTIAEKYGSFQADRRPSQPQSPEELAPPPRRRLQQGRKSARASPEPPSSPIHQLPQPPQRAKKQTVVISDDEDEVEAEDDDSESEPGVQPAETSQEMRLLEFFNECSVQDLADLSAFPEDKASFVLDRRPFTSIDEVRAVSDAKTSRSRAIGDRMADLCKEMLAGYDAVDDLVERCESLAAPIRATLKQWGAGAATDNDGELHLMNLDHDSGIGTPSSSASEPLGSLSSKQRFLTQPSSMNQEKPLKDYQLVGLNWLNLLWSKRLSCILADEMGLGKTCQVISFLAHLQETEVDGVHLIIVPVSTLENWLREFKKFAPALRVIAYYGSEKERFELQDVIEANFDSIDVVVTTLETAVNEKENKFLRKRIDPLVCVLDEAHSLRNRNSKRYRQLSRIPATFRVLLTGTPLQNNLQELMSILEFIMPELFEEKKADLEFIFQHKATTKDVQNTALLSSQRISKARSMMTPFILRRKKDLVLDLPRKNNYVENCDMTPNQYDYYNSLLREFQQYLEARSKSKTKGTPISSNMLMTLRKAAIHPLLARRLFDDRKVEKIATELLKHPEFAGNTLDKTVKYLSGEHHQSFGGGDFGLHRFCQERDYLRKFQLKRKDLQESSGKIETFEKLIQQFVSNGDQILVFSQFTTMLDILETVLDALNIGYKRLDGSTNTHRRQEMIDEFNADPSIPVFMLSTKAGGVGINLASANKVIIFDSGFNPQDEIQAESRAHRVGQTKEVDVYRLVTRGTIEEQIQAVNEMKIKLGQEVADEGNENSAETANAQEVAEMLKERLTKGTDAQESGKAAVGTSASPVDIRDAFKSGLEDAGVRVASKQAQF